MRGAFTEGEAMVTTDPETRDALMKPPKSPGDADACRTHIREFWGADPSHVEPLRGLTQATFPVAWQLMGDDAPG